MHRLNNPFAALIITALAYATFLVLQFSQHDYDFSVFVGAGDAFVDAAAAPAGLTVLPNSDGYDGQFYYRLALTPFTNRQTDLGIRIDTPAYRQQRIVYPLLARLLSFGRATALPLALVLVNYLALCGMAYLGGWYARQEGHSALWGVALTFYPGYLMTLSRDTTEIVASLFLVAFVVAMQRRWWLPAGACLTLAVLTKETSLISAAGILVAAALTRQVRPPGRWLAALAPAAAYGLWQLWLANTWRVASVSSHTFSNNIGLPFVGLTGLWLRLTPPAGHVERVWLAELLLLALFAAVCLALLPRSPVALFVKLAWLLYLGLAITLTETVWVEDWAYLRVLAEVYLFGAMILLPSDSRAGRILLAAAPLAWLFLALDLLYWR